MSALETDRSLTVAQLRRMLRDAMKDKSYQDFPMGQRAAAYLRAKRKRLTESSYRTYEGVLDKLARDFPDLDIEDFEPPIGTTRLEEFMDDRWGGGSARNYNRNLSVLCDFFRWHVIRGHMHGDPTLPIERARTRGVYRTTFTADQVRAIIASQEDLRDRVACRLLLEYALRKGSLRAIQFKHFDHVRKRLTIFAKGGKVRHVPIPDPAFWHDLERLILDIGGQAHHYLMPQATSNQRSRVVHPEKPMSAHRAHDWWYECLERAGIVAKGQRRGEKMHKARHTAGQRLLDHTENLKAVQMLLGHSSIQTTGDIYVGWDEAQLASSLEAMLLEGADSQRIPAPPENPLYLSQNGGAGIRTRIHGFGDRAHSR